MKKIQWLINPPTKRRRKPRRSRVHREIVGKKGSRLMRRKRKATTKRPSAKQVAARRKFAAMARARAKAARSTRTRGRKPVAAKRRRTKARKRTGTMRSVVRRGGAAVKRRSWRASGYRRNPKRRGRVRRRNPGIGNIGNQVMALGKQTVAVMAGRTLGRTLSGLIPFGNGSPIVTAGKGVAVALVIKMFGRRFLSADLADALAVGALIGPVTDLVGAYLPGASPFLSGGPIGMPSFISSYPPRLASYPGLSGAGRDSGYAGSYAQDVYQQ